MKAANKLKWFALVSLVVSFPTLAAGFAKYDGVDGEAARQTAEKPGPRQQDTQKKDARSVTYGPVITVKPKGLHGDEANCEKGLQKATHQTPQGANPASQRDKCFTNH